MAWPLNCKRAITVVLLLCGTVMKILFFLAAMTGDFTIYPGIEGTDPRIEAATQRGPIYELIVKCPAGNAIMTYSPVERRYCSPQFECGSSRNEIISLSCGDGLK